LVGAIDENIEYIVTYTFAQEIDNRSDALSELSIIIDNKFGFDGHFDGL
jgi:hypothetical protein